VATLLLQVSVGRIPPNKSLQVSSMGVWVLCLLVCFNRLTGPLARPTVLP